jgi:hypothetical protein
VGTALCLDVLERARDTDGVGERNCLRAGNGERLSTDLEGPGGSQYPRSSVEEEPALACAA